MTYSDAATKLRNFLKDTEALNILEGVKENTDDDLIEYIKLALIDINFTGGLRTRFGIADVAFEPEDAGTVPWGLVKQGAILEALTSNGILSSRNTLTYSDAGGISVENYDVWSRYINYFNTMITKYTNGVQQFKGRLNFSAGFGGVHSPMYVDGFYS